MELSKKQLKILCAINQGCTWHGSIRAFLNQKKIIEDLKILSKFDLFTYSQGWKKLYLTFLGEEIIKPCILISAPIGFNLGLIQPIYSRTGIYV